MALYSVHLRGSGFQALAEAAFVRQAFSWKAFFLGPLWLAWHRLWAALLLWAGAYLILMVAAARTLISDDAATLIAFFLQILLGLEANRLREAKLAAEGYHLVEILAAPGRDQALVTFYREHEPQEATAAEIASRQPGP